MAPPGTRIIAHAPHDQDGWYIGPSLEHYQCCTVYINRTRGERIVETVDFFPVNFKLPFPSTQELATKAGTELTHALLHPNTAGPFFKVDDEQTIALTYLADIFEGATRSQKARDVIPPPTGWKMLHLQGCKLQFHL
jgi:hypothetical protein